MESEIAIGIAVGFLQIILTVGVVLTTFKVLHWVFEWEDHMEERYYRDNFKKQHGI